MQVGLRVYQVPISVYLQWEKSSRGIADGLETSMKEFVNQICTGEHDLDF